MVWHCPRYSMEYRCLRYVGWYPVSTLYVDGEEWVKLKKDHPRPDLLKLLN
jgi:hypothetical protein